MASVSCGIGFDCCPQPVSGAGLFIYSGCWPMLPPNTSIHSSLLKSRFRAPCE